MSVRALTTLRNCDRIFAEYYTSKLNESTHKEVEAFIGKKVTVLKRAEVEEKTVHHQGRPGPKGGVITRRRPHVRHHPSGP
jgi:diphthamide biosynthesis methyltransferase